MIIIIIIICKDILNPGRILIIILYKINNINFSQPNTNIASFTMASFNSPDNNSILNDSTPLPAILNHETPVRLNIPIEHNYAPC